MQSQEPVQQSTQKDVTQQACAVMTGISLFFCVVVSIFGWLAWSEARQIFPLFTAQVENFFRITPRILYVRPDDTSYSCGSWENACGLQTALAVAKAGDEIWVQAGIYKPAEGTRYPDVTFQLKDGVALYGGFAGTETSRDQRDWGTHITVLSGDLGGDDTTDPNGVVTDTENIVGQNAYHVVTGSGVDNTAVLDGFVITAGYASLTPPLLHGYGGGMISWEGSPTLNNLIFSGNTAGKGKAYYGGGGMLNIHFSNPVLTNVTFIANTAGSGGGMYNHESNPTLTEVTFIDNEAGDSGGMNNYMNSSPTLTDVTFFGNVATVNGGGMGNKENGNPILVNVTFSKNLAGDCGGGMANFQGRPTLTNVTFSDNSAGKFGGGLCNTTYTQLTNATFTGNEAPRGSGIYNRGGLIKMVNGIVWGNTPAQEQIYNQNIKLDITYSDIQGGFPGAGNLNVVPRFGEFGNHGGLTGLFALLPDSPLIDKGSPSVCPTTDQTGLSRPVDGDGDGSATCDMGAYEYRTPE